MAVAGGPNTVEDGLVFFYDTGNGKSYKGEPTVNLFTNPTFLGTSGTQTSAVSKNWSFSGDSTSAGFNFYNNTTSPIPLKFPNEGAVITTGTTASNRRIYFRGPVEPSTTYTISYWAYSSALSAVTNYFFTYDSGSNHINSDPYTFSSALTVGRWTYVETSYTTPSNTDNTRYTNWGPVIAGANNTLIAIQRFQVEAKSHATPFVNGTRSATEGLKDLTRNSSIDLTNAGFDSNAEIDLDGTGDYFETTTENQLASDQTLEAVFIKDQDSSPHTTILCTDIAYEHGIKLMAYKNSARYGMWLGFGSGGDVYNAFVNTALPNNEYLHLAGTWEQSTGIIKIYLNGELTGTISTGRTDDIQTRSGGRITIGADYHSLGNPYGTYAQVPIAKIYNRALTAEEVKSNYNGIRSRFGI